MEVVPSPALSLKGHFGCVGSRRWQSTLSILQVPLNCPADVCSQMPGCVGELSRQKELVSGPFACSGESVSRTSVDVSSENSQEVVTQLT